MENLSNIILSLAIIIMTIGFYFWLSKIEKSIQKINIKINQELFGDTKDEPNNKMSN